MEWAQAGCAPQTLPHCTSSIGWGDQFRRKGLVGPLLEAVWSGTQWGKCDPCLLQSHTIQSLPVSNSSTLPILPQEESATDSGWVWPAVPTAGASVAG